MVGIQGLGGVQEPEPNRPANVRDQAESTAASKGKDDLVISSAAQAAATLATTIQAAATIPDVRADRVAAAREAIERGDYKRPDIVAQVADRINKLL